MRANQIKNKFSQNVDELPESYVAALGHTTHLTVVDKSGMMVSLTQTIGTTMGSKVATPGLGFMYAQTLGGYLGEITPGMRAPSHISPIIVERQGKPFLALGAAGGSRIPSSLVAVISRVIDQSFTLDEAMKLPRVHPTAAHIEIENIPRDDSFPSHFTDKIISMDDSLFFLRRGLNPRFRDGTGNFGRVYAVMKEGDVWVGVSDPDWQGSSGYVK